MQTLSVRAVRALVIAAGVVVASPWSMAQVMTPPPKETPAPDANIPKLPPPAPRAQAQPAPVNTAPAEQPKPRFVLPTDVDYNALIKKDADGKVQAPSEPIYHAAMRANPKIPQSFWEDNKQYMQERQQTLHLLIANNLDLMDKIEDGIFESTKYTKESVNELLNTVRPLMRPAAPDSITKDMRAKQLLDETQFRVTEEMVRKYSLALNPVPNMDVPREERGDASWRTIIQLYKVGFDEISVLHRRLGIEIGRSASDLLPRLTLDGSVTQQAKDAVSKAGTPATDADRLALTRRLRDILPMEARKELYRQAASVVEAGK
jgi:hypothetical protein